MPAAAPLVRSPLAGRPEIHQIVLPTPWPIGPVQIYVIEAEPLTLVDTGVRTPESFAALTAAFDALGLGLDEVRRIVLTHYHEDHLGQAQTLRELGGDLEVWCHADEREWCEAFSAERNEWIEPTERLFREYGVPSEILARQSAMRRQHASGDPLCDATRIDRVLHEGDPVGFKDFELGVIHAPGHTQGHLLLHDSASGALITGDSLMGNAVPFTIVTYGNDAEPDLSDPLARRPRFVGLPEYVGMLRRLRQQRYKMILPAHGGLIERPNRAIEEALLFYEVRIQRIARTVEGLIAELGRPVSAFEVWRRQFPKADPVTEMRTRLYMVIGALETLVREGRLAALRRADDGVLLYDAA